MTIKQVLELMPDTQGIRIFDRGKCDVVYDGAAMHLRGGYREKEVAFMKVYDYDLVIDVDS